MKVVVTGTRGFPGIQGGVEIHCEQLYPHMVKKGCEVTVFTRKPYVHSNMLTYKGVSLVPIDCPRNKFFEAITHSFKSILKARRLKPDLLHIHGIGPSMFAPLARILGMKVVVTIHSQNYRHLKWGFFSRLFLRFCEAVGLLFSNSVITVSRELLSDIEKKYHRPAVFIPNGVLMPCLSETEENLRNYGIKKQKYILSVGRFVPEKGFSDLLDAFNIGDFGDWKLVIVGNADHESKYSRDLKVKAETNSNIILTGLLTDRPLQEIYSHAGLFVLPSYYEGLPIVLLEAMSYGLSCIASDIPANRNIEIDDNRFFKSGDIDSLAAKMEEFIEKPITEPEKEKQTGIISEKYDWDKIADRTMEVYRAVSTCPE